MSQFNKELVKAFNINNYHLRTMHTNFTVQDLDGRDYITMTFADGINGEQCISYLNNLREKIIEEFYQSENGAKKSFKFDYFPFNQVNHKSLYKDRNNRWQFRVPITSSVLFNLKSHLAHSMSKYIKIDLAGQIGPKMTGWNQDKYIMCTYFSDRKSANEFMKQFLSKIKKYTNPPSKTLKVKGNDVYIRDIFNNQNIDLIKNATQDTACNIGRCLEFDSTKISWTTEFKEIFAQFILCSTGIKINKYENASYIGTTENSIIMPTVRSENGENRHLNVNEINAINHAFGFKVLNGLIGCIERDNLSINSPELQRKGIYGIDFSNKDIANCIINTILENSLVNQVSRDYELVVKSSPQLIKLYIQNIKLGNIRRPSTPEILRPSTSWQTDIKGHDILRTAPLRPGSQQSMKPDGIAGTQYFTDKPSPPLVSPKPAFKEADSTTDIYKAAKDILQKEVKEVQSDSSMSFTEEINILDISIDSGVSSADLSSNDTKGKKTRGSSNNQCLLAPLATSGRSLSNTSTNTASNNKLSDNNQHNTTTTSDGNNELSDSNQSGLIVPVSLQLYIKCEQQDNTQAKETRKNISSPASSCSLASTVKLNLSQKRPSNESTIIQSSDKEDKSLGTSRNSSSIDDGVQYFHYNDLDKRKSYAERLSHLPSSSKDITTYVEKEEKRREKDKQKDKKNCFVI